MGLPIGRDQLVGAFENFVEACEALQELFDSVVPEQFVQPCVQFDDEFAGLAPRFDAFFGQKDTNGPSVCRVGPALNQPAILHAFEGP